MLRTPRKIKLKKLLNGEYIHFNLNDTLTRIIKVNKNYLSNPLKISFNIDGLPIFKDSNTQFWPILCQIKQKKMKPFVIGIFCGESKPNTLEMFLEDFIADLNFLLHNGISHEGINFAIEVHSFVCDAPAKAYIKCHKSHGGYSSCDKCTEYGSYVDGRVILPIKNNASKRTDLTFYEQTDETHHLGVSPLTDLKIGLVSNFPIDYMHAVCLGVMRKLLNSWIGGNLKVRLSSLLVKTLSDQLLSLTSFIPAEINRKPRAIKDLARWKATEFRTFLLYLGPLVLKDILDIGVYENFLLFHCAISILCSNYLIKKIGVKTANKLLREFVIHCEQIYGKQYLVYNVHILIHLCDDANVFGNLDMFSAFPFENFLGQLKKLVKGPYKPLHQVYGRLIEGLNNIQAISQSSIEFLYEHNSGPLLNFNTNYKQFKKVIFNDFLLTNCDFSKADCYFLTKDRNVVKIYNIVSNKCDDNFLIGKYFTECSSLYDYPFSSSYLNIYELRGGFSNLQKWAFSDIATKCIIFPSSQKNIFVSFPLLHTRESDK